MNEKILRVVRLSFKEEHINQFLNIFNTSQHKIQAFDGCRSVILKRDFDFPNVFYTVSEWDNHEALEKYRKSELFSITWAKTKVLFDDKPSAFSLKEVNKI